VRRVSGNFTATQNDYMLLVDASAGALSGRLYSITNGGQRELFIVQTGSNSNVVTLRDTQGNVITTLSGQAAAVSLQIDDRGDWHVFGSANISTASGEQLLDTVTVNAFIATDQDLFENEEATGLIVTKVVCYGATTNVITNTPSITIKESVGGGTVIQSTQLALNSSSVVQHLIPSALAKVAVAPGGFVRFKLGDRSDDPATFQASIFGFYKEA
jgi:hypothetical protein